MSRPEILVGTMVKTTNGKLGMVYHKSHIGTGLIFAHEEKIGNYSETITSIVKDEDLPIPTLDWLIEKRQEWDEYWKIQGMEPVQWAIIDWKMGFSFDAQS